MGNLITHSLTFSKESATEYFIKPLFVDGELANEMDIRLDIKNSEKLNEISSLSGIVKAYAQGTSFTASTGVTITQRTLTVEDLKAEVRQNGKAFLKMVGESLLKKGWAENDITDTQFEQIILELMIRAIKKDIQVIAWFGDAQAETVSSNVKTGTADTTRNVLTGHWTRIIDDFAAGTIPAAQRVTMANAATAQVDTVTLSGTSGTCNITVMGKTYLATFDTDLTTTATNFVTAHAAALALRDVTVTSGTGTLIFTSAIAGVSLGTVAVSAALTGNLTGTRAATTANVAAAALTTDEALSTFESMRAAAPDEMLENKDMLVIFATRSMVENYKNSLQAVGAGEQAYTATIDGVQRLTWDGIPIIEKASWDTTINTKLAKAYPHRALMTYKEALIAGTDGSEDSMNLELYYDQNAQENVFRSEFKLGTQYRAVDYIVAAY